MRAIIKFLLLCSFALPSNAAHYLHSPRRTQYGDWHAWKHCPHGMYAAGMQIKYEGDQRGGDDTALNAVSLYCLPLDSTSYNNDNWIMSGEGAYGAWQAVKWCPKGQIVIGFALRSEPDQRGGDDVAADNFAAYCGSPFGARSRNNWVQGDTEGWGDWTADQWCPEDTAVCGIQSQIEAPVGGGDDTSLNNVNLECCEVSQIPCTPTHTFVPLSPSYDNTRGAGTMEATFKTRVSFQRTVGETRTLTNSEKRVVGARVSSKIGTEISSINVEISEENERVTESSVQAMIQDTITNESERSFTIHVPPGKRANIKQLYLTCGGYSIGLAKIIVHQ